MFRRQKNIPVVCMLSSMCRNHAGYLNDISIIFQFQVTDCFVAILVSSRGRDGD